MKRKEKVRKEKEKKMEWPQRLASAMRERYAACLAEELGKYPFSKFCVTE